jgi:hypothetical protein
MTTVADIRAKTLAEKTLKLRAEPEDSCPGPRREPLWPEIGPVAFDNLLGEIVRVIEPHSEADPNGLLLQLLVAFGNAIGSGPYYQVEGDRHRTKLFLVLAGATSKGRKGTGLGRIRQLMADVDAEWERNNIQSGLSSGEGLIFHVRDPAEPKPGKEEEADPGVIDKRLMLVVEEFAGTLRVMERPGNTLSPYCAMRGARPDCKR